MDSEEYIYGNRIHITSLWKRKLWNKKHKIVRGEGGKREEKTGLSFFSLELLTLDFNLKVSYFILWFYFIYMCI